VKAFRFWKLSDWPTSLFTITDLKQVIKLLLHSRKIYLWSKRVQALLLHVEQRTKEAARATEENDAYIDALTTLDIGNDADDGIII
jgi:hypothetical protein